MSEAAITKRILSWLRTHGYWAMKIHGGPMQLAGVPDILAIKGGRAYFLEVKRPGGKVSKLQELTIAALNAAGAVAAVVTSLEEAIAVVQGAPFDPTAMR